MLFLLVLWFLGPIFAALLVHAQTQWCDSVTNICFQRHYLQNLDTGIGYIFPPLPAAGQPASSEFIGIFTAPIATGWIGNSLGGEMRNDLLIIGWMDNGRAVLSARYVKSYQLPAPYAGPVLTVLGSTGANSTHQRIVYRCQNCTTWDGGSIPADGPLGYAVHAAIKPDTPSNPNSNFLQHTVAGQHGFSVANARTSQYSVYLQQLLNTPTGTTSPTTTPPTTTPPTPTGPLQCPGAPAPTYSMIPASGFRVTPVLGRLSSPRGIALDTRGNLIVVQRGMGISGHAVDANGCVTSSKTIISDTAVNHGIDVTATKIFASSPDIAWVWDYDPVTMTATNKRTLITGMYNAGHITRTLWASRKYPDYLIVSVGSNGNIDLPSFAPAAGRAILKVFDLRTIPTNGVNYASGGKVLGYGLRNDVGMAEDRAGIIHSVENSMDDAYRTINGQRRDVHNDNPAEKIYNLGNPSSPNTAFFGGYPYCFTVWEPSNFVDKSFTVGDWFVQAPNTTLTDAWCEANSRKPTALLPPHTAPLDMKFGIGPDSAAYVSLHGSWNRNPPQGYRVVAVNGQFSASGEWSPTGPLSSRNGFVDILRNRDETQCQSGCFRPVGLVWSTSGENLYVSSDTSGEVFLLKKNGGPVVTTTPPPTTTPPTTTPPTTTPPTTTPPTTTPPTTTPPTTTPPTTTPPTTTPPTTTPPTTTAPPQPTQTLWGQCAGNGYNGPKLCPSGSTCRFQNDWYSQCVP